MSRLSNYLGVHSTLVSQVLKQHKSFSTDQAAMTSEFLGLTELESEYFVLLVQLDRAGNSAAKNHFSRQLQRVLEHANTISRRVKVDAELSEEQRAVFYSDWAYSAIRQSVAIPGLNHAEPIAEHLGLPRKKVQKILEFLVKAGLCKIEKGEYKVGPASTHVEASSPWVRVHHTNWRQKAIQSLDGNQPNKLFYTSPLTLSKRDCDAIREKILQFIEQVNSIVDPSPSETFYCLNVDWFPIENKPN